MACLGDLETYVYTIGDIEIRSKEHSFPGSDWYYDPNGGTYYIGVQSSRARVVNLLGLKEILVWSHRITKSAPTLLQGYGEPWKLLVTIHWNMD